MAVLEIVAMSSLMYSKKRCWGKMYLSWNKKQHTDFVKELQARLLDIGIDVIIKGTYSEFLAEKLANPHSPLLYFTSVVMTEEYASSTSCVTGLIKMLDRDEVPWPILYFNENEKDEDTEERCIRYTMLAGAALNIPEERRLEVYEKDVETTPYQAMTIVFTRARSLILEYDHPEEDVKQKECAFIETHVCPTYKGLHPFAQLPCLQHIYNVLSNDDDEIIYLGIMGTNSRACKPMTAIVKSLSPRHTRQVSTTQVRYIKVIDQKVVRYNKWKEPRTDLFPSLLVSGDSLQDWGAGLMHSLLSFGENIDNTHLQDLLEKNDYLLVIDNLGDYNQLKEIAKVVDLANRSSKVVFTTTNPDFFPKDVQWNNCILQDHNKPKLGLSCFKGKISEQAGMNHRHKAVDNTREKTK